MFGVTTVARGTSISARARTASSARSRDPERPRDLGDDRGAGEHPDLDGIGADIIEHRSYLGAHELGRHLVNAGDAVRVLRRERGDGGHAPDVEGAHGLQVRLNAGAASRVGTRDDQNALHDFFPPPSDRSRTISPSTRPPSIVNVP
jgi:hypothetical protein